MAAQFQRQGLDLVGRALDQRPADLRGAGEADLAAERIVEKLLGNFPGGTGDHLKNAFR